MKKTTMQTLKWLDGTAAFFSVLHLGGSNITMKSG
jgi:hypothetical protein